MDQKKELTVTKEIAIIDENSLKSRIFTIRGIKVMLDLTWRNCMAIVQNDSMNK